MRRGVDLDNGSAAELRAARPVLARVTLSAKARVARDFSLYANLTLAAMSYLLTRFRSMVSPSPP